MSSTPEEEQRGNLVDWYQPHSRPTKNTIQTQREAAVQLQVGGEEAGQAAEQFAAGLPSIQLITAVHQTVGRGAVVGLVQDAHQQLALTDQHLESQRGEDLFTGF